LALPIAMIVDVAFQCIKNYTLPFYNHIIKELELYSKEAFL
jgi:hypothetical protein